MLNGNNNNSNNNKNQLELKAHNYKGTGKEPPEGERDLQDSSKPLEVWGHWNFMCLESDFQENMANRLRLAAELLRTVQNTDTPEKSRGKAMGKEKNDL